VSARITFYCVTCRRRTSVPAHGSGSRRERRQLKFCVPCYALRKREEKAKSRGEYERNRTAIQRLARVVNTGTHPDGDPVAPWKPPWEDDGLDSARLSSRKLQSIRRRECQKCGAWLTKSELDLYANTRGDPGPEDRWCMECVERAPHRYDPHWKQYWLDELPILHDPGLLLLPEELAGPGAQGEA